MDALSVADLFVIDDGTRRLELQMLREELENMGQEDLASLVGGQLQAQELAHETSQMPKGTAWLGSVICRGTVVFLGSALLSTLGKGNPDSGGRFLGSGSMFDEVSAQILALIPDGGWQGSAALAYVAQDLAQSRRAKVIGDLDHQTAGLVSAQAEAISNTRAWLIGEMAFVAAVGGCCWALEKFGGPGGQQVSLALAVLVCFPAISVASYQMASLCITTSRNASNLQELTQRLTYTVTRSPTSSDTIPGAPELPLPPEHSGFEVADRIISKPLDNAAPPPGTPDISCVLAEVPGWPGLNVPDLPTPGFSDFGAPHLRVPQLSGMPNLNTPDGFATLPDFVGRLGTPRPSQPAHHDSADGTPAPAHCAVGDTWAQPTRHHGLQRGTKDPLANAARHPATGRPA